MQKVFKVFLRHNNNVQKGCSRLGWMTRRSFTLYSSPPFRPSPRFIPAGKCVHSLPASQQILRMNSSLVSPEENPETEAILPKEVKAPAEAVPEIRAGSSDSGGPAPEREFYIEDPDKVLAATMTPELEQAVLAGVPHGEFALKKLLAELEHLQTKKPYPLPMPEHLTVDEWRELLSLSDYRSRIYYLNALLLGDKDIGKILDLEQVFCGPLKIDEELIASVVGDDKEGRRKIQLFLMHHEMQRQSGEVVPYTVTDKDLFEISNIESINGYKRFIDFLLSKEFGNLNKLIKLRSTEKVSELRVREAQEYISRTKHIYYGLGHNTIFLRFSDRTMTQYFNWMAVREFNEWGIPLVVDMSFFSNIKNRVNAKSLVYHEISNMISLNKTAKLPFQLHFTGVGDECRKLMRQFMPWCETPDNCFNITSESHLDMFPHERLVYLSPDSNNDLKHFDPEDVYIIGGLVDRGNDKMPYTLSAAKRLKIRHARFPLRQHIGVVSELNVDACLAIMCDLRETQDWFYAFRWVAPRFLARRIKSGSPHLEHSLVYRAHKYLSPFRGKPVDQGIYNRNLNPAQYREYYKKIMLAETPAEVEQLMEDLRKL